MYVGIVPQREISNKKGGLEVQYRDVMLAVNKAALMMLSQQRLND